MNRARTMQRIAVAGLLGLLAGIPAAAQGPGRGSKEGRGPGALYDPANEVTVRGTITAIPSDACSLGRHLTLKTDTETIDVALGPAAFLAEQKVTLAISDAIEVTGAKVAAKAGDPAFVARVVKKGDAVLTLRNEQGIPLWSKGARR